MTLKQLRGRLDRLELSPKPKEVKIEETYTPPSYDFPIDPAVVQELQDEYGFLSEVKFPWFNHWTNGKRPIPEEFQTRARIAALASTIHCPPSYGFPQYWDDHKIRRAREAGDPIRAQAIARMEAYKQNSGGTRASPFRLLRKWRWTTRSRRKRGNGALIKTLSRTLVRSS